MVERVTFPFTGGLNCAKTTLENKMKNKNENRIIFCINTFTQPVIFQVVALLFPQDLFFEAQLFWNIVYRKKACETTP